MGWLTDISESIGDNNILLSEQGAPFFENIDQNFHLSLPAYKLFTCDICCTQFRYLKSFEKHKLTHALEGLHNPFQRPSSVASDGRNERNKNETSEIVHTVAHHDNEKLINTNEALPPVLVAGSSVPKQESIATKNDSGVLRLGAERPSFSCPFCGKCVRLKENLKLHIRKHTGERPFSCVFCGRAFGGKSDLTRHQRIHTGERPYHCDTCGKRFARADYLSKHLATHTHHPHHQR